MKDLSFIFNAHPKVISEYYDRYQQDPESVDEGWRLFFRGFDFAGSGNGSTTAATADRPQATDGVVNPKEFRVYSIIRAYRNRGHLQSTTNPIRPRIDRHPNLALEDFNLSEADLDTVFQAGNEIGLGNATLREIIEHLEKVYCRNIGFEFMHLTLRKQRRWLRERIEAVKPDTAYGLSIDKKKRILEKLNGAVGFEDFLGKKYVGQKRFSLEGGETTIAALDAIINKAAEYGAEETVIGMAHRGRLNVLANIMGKSYASIFNEFEGKTTPNLALGDGDVKYHLGYSALINTSGDKKVNLKLIPNPSHLESVDPVVQGFTRAKRDILYDDDPKKIFSILIHGDAAAAGQGVVYETAQMSELDGYETGGTVHFVINNQIGFTTDFTDGRSSHYCTAAANAINVPVFHVNGDDPEAVVFAAELAVEFRNEFNVDVWIDMVCYRKHGHNEGDDPNFTQPEMYDLIKKHKNPREMYVEQLLQRGDIEGSLAEKMENEFRDMLQSDLDEVKEHDLPYEYQEPELAWKKLNKKVKDPEFFLESPATGIDRARIDSLLEGLMHIPKEINIVSKVKRLTKGKQKLLDENLIDWAFAELMAYGSVMQDGGDVRMTGQDVKRGTFSHRHAVYFDDGTTREYNRLNHVKDVKGEYRIFNSLLSEFAVMGFEYGYALASPDNLVIWEAQFGDFYNGAQTIVDQYVTSAESKWQRMNGLVLLLPHGYEGQGPEHSSARLERFLQSCAEFNITVANCTTPANFFHLLRRQLARDFRKPLVVMSPKSLLRHPEVVSKIEEFTTGNRFNEVLDDPSFNKTAGKQVKRLLLCTGKVYYDLLAKQREEDRKDVAIVRVEQLYPLPVKQLEEMFSKYPKAELVWVQEESSNMGAWQYMNSWNLMQKDLRLISRRSSASPATGFKKVHDTQQEKIVEEAFEL